MRDLSADIRQLFPDGSAKSGAQLTALVSAVFDAVALGATACPPSDLSTQYEGLESRFTLQDVLERLPAYLDGVGAPGSTNCLRNIIPNPMLLHIAIQGVLSQYMLNGVAVEDSASALRAEVETTRVLAGLFGWDAGLAGGIYTFGGSATNLYAMRIGIEKTGCLDRSSGVYIASRASHFSQKRAASWLGVPTENFIEVPVMSNQSVDTDAFSRALRVALESEHPVFGLLLSGGTTSGVGVDDIAQIAAVRDSMVSEFGLEYPPHIHVDSSIGWAYAAFKGHELSASEDDEIRAFISHTVTQLDGLRMADSAGVDFHKTGYMPYQNSLFMCRNADDFRLLSLEAHNLPIMHQDGIMNPGMYTLETSRNASAMVASYLCLRMLGAEGLRDLLLNASRNARAFKRELLEVAPELAIPVDINGAGPDFFFQVRDVGSSFPSNASPAHNGRTDEFARWLPGSRHGLVLGRTSAARYEAGELPLVAIRVHCLNALANTSAMRDTARRTALALNEFLGGADD